MQRAIATLLSERYRPVVLPLLVALLVSLCAHWVHVHLTTDTGYQRLLRDPMAYDGGRVVLSLVTAGEALGPQRYLVHEGTLSLTVIGPADAVIPGREYTVLGEWDGANQAVRATEVHEAVGRPAKKALGILGLIATGALVPVFFTLAPGGVALRG